MNFEFRMPDGKKAMPEIPAELRKGAEKVTRDLASLSLPSDIKATLAADISALFERYRADAEHGISPKRLVKGLDQ
ncbi:MAG TPA: hypothetical protein VJB97_03440 [Candidatus Paceibacterota bacterium]